MKFLYFFMVTVILVGCSEEFPTDTENREQSTTTNTRVSILDALEHAEAIMADFEPGTRSETRKVASIESVLSDSRTRSGEQDTLLYVVNYDDDMGYAILGADQRANPVYAFSTEGNINLNDTVKDEMFSLFVNAAIEDAADSMNSPLIIGGGGGTGGLTPTYVMEYHNKRIADAGIPKHLQDLICGNVNDCDTKELISSDMALAFLKIFPTVMRDSECALYTDFANITSATNLKECWDTVLFVNELFNSTLKNYGIENVLWEARYYISKENNITGCGCKSYWGMRCNVHTEQMFNLLSDKWNGYHYEGKPQGFIVIARDEFDKNTPCFVVDAFRTHDAYKYSYYGHFLVSGPVPEQWMHCLWSKNSNSNGYFLYMKKDDTMTVEESSNITQINTLQIFGGFIQDKTSGL